MERSNGEGVKSGRLGRNMGKNKKLYNIKYKHYILIVRLINSLIFIYIQAHFIYRQTRQAFGKQRNIKDNLLRNIPVYFHSSVLV